MSYNSRVRTRDLMSAEYNPERRTLDPDRKFEQKRVFGIMVREKSPQASTLVLCVIPESSFARFGDPVWVDELKANSGAHDLARIDQLKLAYEKERDFLLGNSGKSVFPWAYIYFPINAKGAEAKNSSRNGSAREENGTSVVLPLAEEPVLAEGDEHQIAAELLRVTSVPLEARE